MTMIRAGLVMAALCTMVYVPGGQAQQLVLAGVEEGGQVKDELLAGTEKFAQGATDVTEVNLDKDMLNMVATGKHKDKNGADLAGRMDFVVVHSYSYDKPGMYRAEDVEVFRKKLTDGSWNCFVHTRERTETTDLCSRSPDHGETNELVIMTSEPKELTFVHMKGRMSIGELRGMHGLAGAMLSEPAIPPMPHPAHVPSPPPAPPSPRALPAPPAPAASSPPPQS